MKKHLTELLGLKEQAKKLGLGSLKLKLRLAKAPGGGKVENFANVSDSQLELEASSVIAKESKESASSRMR